MKPITAIVLGAGQRGANVYAAYARNFPNELKIVGVAEPRADRRAAFAADHGTVSYTHLDVYKRQVGEGAAPIILECASCFRLLRKQTLIFISPMTHRQIWGCLLYTSRCV